MTCLKTFPDYHDELGYFQFGGSTHCLVFQKGVIDKFDLEIGQDVKMGSLITRGK